MRDILVVGLYVISMVMVLVGSGCVGGSSDTPSPTATATPVPTPTPVAIPSQQVYDYLKEEKDGNSTNFKHIVKGRPTWRFDIKISDIQDNRIQEHFNRPSVEPDSYIECEFKDELAILNLRKGNTYSVYGTLYEAFDNRLLRPDSKAIKFRNCRFQ